MSNVKLKEKKTVAKRDFLTLLDYSKEEILYFIEEAFKLEENPIQPLLKGKTLAMIFEKSSTRTRVSFETGMLQLGGHALFLSSQDLQLGRGEPISDTAKVLSGYVDGIMIRTFGHDKIEELAKHATIPVINGLTDLFHPCQALADLKTIYRLKGKFEGVKTAYLGDGNNVAHSLMIAAAKVGMDFSIGCPKGYEPEQWVVEEALKIAKETGATISIVNDPIEAVKDADILYTDVWASMGQESEQQERIIAFKGYQVNDELVKHAKSDYHFLHCLPAHREEEVTASIIDGEHSAVFEQAENRLHVQKALLKELLS
ncbi:ornithine carbamoyltransferase [Metabacillus niabensis]|uniref:Ornithine carbamoyltransferase n=1 Tax=Metabacillus niabensis TaxID=324854 RepID=A0ABT9YWI2_9BACI|nr:ornithine carbamoyltransferase [Metabacillus niabensis]MDQ0224175.1 ornithine carbamoyltransferase [Metabacillus niabensis]PAD68582.1 ornithine carbamoyltransferase [Bacillus sp. 7586-K]